MTAPDFVDRYGPWAVVAGAALGLGAEFSRQLASRGCNLVLVSLEDRELRELAASLSAEHEVEARPVTADLGTRQGLEVVLEACDGIQVGLLVYNAGLSATSPFLDTPLDRHLAIVDVNIRGALTLLDGLLPPMRARGRGGVVLLSSLSALQGTPLVATYAATKAFTLSLAESLWDELAGLGIDVTAVLPGPTDTPGYRSSAPRRTRLTPAPMPVEPVVAAALDGLGRRPWVIPGRQNRIAGFLFARLLPRRTAVRLMGRTMRSMYGAR